MEGVAEWQVNAVIVSMLIRKFTRRRVVASMSVAMHLFHGALLGIVFRLLQTSSSDRPARNNDSVIVSHRLCHCLQRCALDHLSLLDKEVLRASRRIPDDTERISGQLPRAQYLRRIPRTSDSSNFLSLKTVHESHVSLSASSRSSPATSNNSAFSQHSNDSLERGLWSWTASLPGFVRQTLFHRTPLLKAPFHSVSVALTNTSP